MNNNDGKSYYGIRLDNSKLKNDAAQSCDILHNIGKAAEAEGDRIDKAFNRIGRTLVGVFSIQQAKNFAQQVINVRGEIQSLEKSFEIFAGKEYGRKLFAEIRDFAVKTPMAMGDLAKGAQTLLSFNIAAQDVMPILRAIGDISMGNAQKFNSLTLAFSQMSSTGKLMGQDLLQMINAGFNPLSVISEQTGKSIGVLKKEMEEGAISADMIKKAFMDATSEGGKFNGMLEQQSKGIEGAMSNLEGAIEDMFNTIGKNSEGIISGSIQAATDLVNNYEKAGEVIAELIVTYGVYKTALITINALKSISTSLTAGWTAAELAHYNALLLVEKAQRLLNATVLKNPYALAAAAVAALVYGLYKFFDVENQSKKAADDHAAAIEDLNQKYATEQNHINEVVDAIRSETTARIERINAMNELKGLYPDIFDKYIDEKGHIRDLIGLQRELNEAQANKRMDEEDDRLDDYRRMFSDYKQLQHAEDHGWSWANAGTFHNVNKLTEDWGVFQSRDSFLKEKVQYWESMVAKQQKVVDENNYTRFVADLANKTDEELEHLRQTLDNVEKLTESGKMRFEAVNSEIASRNPDLVRQDKSYWDEYKKQQQAKLDAMTEAELATKEAARIRKNIADAQKKIDAYSVSKGTATATRETKDENSEALRADARRQRLQDYADVVSREARQAELDIEQARIDGMKEGLEKELAQNELNYKRLVEANRQRQDEMVRALADAKELEWENENPKAKEQGLTFDRSTITAADLSDEQQSKIREYARIAEEIRQRANKESLEKMLSDVLTYEQSRQQIKEEYASKREALYTTDGDGNKVLREGVSQGNVEELDRQANEALQAVDEQFAAREETYQAWCNIIGELTLEQLQDLLTRAKSELEALEENGASGTDLAMARAKINKLDGAVKNANAKDKFAPKKRTIKEWQDLYSTLNECAGAFDDIGDAVGGSTGEILKAAGQISTSTLSMINGIVTLANSSGTAMAGTAAAASTAIQTVEKASVILAVISAALQIATAIANLFNDDEEKQKEIERLQDRIDQLQWELDNADIMRLNAQYGSSVERVRKSMYEARVEMINLAAATGRWFSLLMAYYGKLSNNTNAMKKVVKDLADQYEKMSYTADKALGDARYDDYYSQLENISKQQILIQEQIENEKDKKDTDWGKISEWERRIEELGQQAVAVINDMLEDIIGGSAVQISEMLSDAFFDAFANGEDAAVAWGDKVKEIASDIVKRMMVQKMLEPEIGKIFDKYKAQWFKDGKFVGAEEVKNSMGSFMADLMATQDVMTQIWNSIPEELKQYLTKDAEREGVEKGIATASQDSVDELNSRATAIQSHTYSIRENSKLLVANTTAILSSVTAIEAHTEVMSTRLESVERNVKEMRDTLDDFNMQGMKLKK